jgi:O-antigen/teichoic acid export membrane protein
MSALRIVGCTGYFLVTFLCTSIGVLNVSLLTLLVGFGLNDLCYSALALAERRSKLLVAAELFRVSVAVPFLALHVLLGKLTSEYVLAYMCLGYLSSNLLLMINLRPPRGDRWDTAIFKRMVAYGFPLSCWFALALAQPLVGRSFLHYHHLERELGVYTAFQEVTTKASTLLFMPLTYALHGYVMALWAEKDYGRARDAIFRSYLYYSFLGLGIGTGAYLCYPLCERFFFGNPLIGSGRFLFVVLMGAAMFTQMGLLSHKGLEVGERTKLMLAAMAMSVLMNGGLCFLLMPLGGTLGVAGALLASSLVYCVLTHTFSHATLATAARDKKMVRIVCSVAPKP